MGEDRFLDRWSRLKRATEEPGPDAAETSEPDTIPAGAVAEEAEMTPEEVAALPDVASVATPEALGVFLRRGVPAALRHAALRRMWVLNPAIRDYVDDAREYAMDWNAPGGVPGGGIVSREEAQALVERLFAPRGPRAAPAAPDDAGAEGDAAEAVVQAPETAEDSGAEAAPDDGVAGAGTAMSQAPRRRHGGATPT
jgi:hypothetical protein